MSISPKKSTLQGGAAIRRIHLWRSALATRRGLCPWNFHSIFCEPLPIFPCMGSVQNNAHLVRHVAEHQPIGEVPHAPQNWRFSNNWEMLKIGRTPKLKGCPGPHDYAEFGGIEISEIGWKTAEQQPFEKWAFLAKNGDFWKSYEIPTFSAFDTNCTAFRVPVALILWAYESPCPLDHIYPKILTELCSKP